MKALIRLLQVLESKNFTDDQINSLTDIIEADDPFEKVKRIKKGFQVPTVMEIESWLRKEKPNIVSPTYNSIAIKFFSFYDSKGWKVGKTPMKNWHSALSGWIARMVDSQEIRFQVQHINATQSSYIPEFAKGTV